MFAADSNLGLTEYLEGTAVFADILIPTAHEKLSLISSGKRHQRSPEHLASPRLPELITMLRKQFDVIVFDTPPLSVGIDAYAMSAAAGNLLMVVRIGHTERRLTSAKIAIASRLPINLIGTVLNGVALDGEFKYYGYTSGYEIREEEAQLTSTSGA
jgi:Mrp family chromosome partitioning ATPase